MPRPRHQGAAASFNEGHVIGTVRHFDRHLHRCRDGEAVGAYQCRPLPPGGIQLFRCLLLVTGDDPLGVLKDDDDPSQVRNTVAIACDDFEPVKPQKLLMHHVPIHDLGGCVVDPDAHRELPIGRFRLAHASDPQEEQARKEQRCARETPGPGRPREGASPPGLPARRDGGSTHNHKPRRPQSRIDIVYGAGFESMYRQPGFGAPVPFLQLSELHGLSSIRLNAGGVPYSGVTCPGGGRTSGGSAVDSPNRPGRALLGQLPRPA
jgi:hypothetical protein